MRQDKPGGFFYWAERSRLFMIVAALLCVSLLISTAEGTARKENHPQELTLEEAQEKAVENNYDLRMAKNEIKQGELMLEELEEMEEELEDIDWEEIREDLDEEAVEEEEVRELVELIMVIIDLATENNNSNNNNNEEENNNGEENNNEIEDETIEDLTEVINKLIYDAQLATLASLTEIIMPSLKYVLDNQIEEAEEELENARDFISIQEEMIKFGAASVFTGILIMEESKELQEKAHHNLEKTKENEKLRLGEGYSSELEVEETRSQIRESEEGLEELENQKRSMQDELCMMMGEEPGTEFKLVEFSPQDKDLPKTGNIDLEAAVKDAQQAGIVEMHRENYQDLQEEFDDPEEMEELMIENARLQYLQAHDQARAEVREAYYALETAENNKYRAQEGLREGKLQEEAMEAQLEAGYVTPAEAAAGELARLGSEMEEYTSRYQHYLAYREFELARDGYFLPEAGTGMEEEAAPNGTDSPQMPGMPGGLEEPGMGEPGMGEPGAPESPSGNLAPDGLMDNFTGAGGSQEADGGFTPAQPEGTEGELPFGSGGEADPFPGEDTSGEDSWQEPPEENVPEGGEKEGQEDFFPEQGEERLPGPENQESP